MKFLVVLTACGLIAGVANAAPPPAPTITVAATDIKQLQFDITPVPTIGHYELWFRALPGAAWVKYTETPGQRPLFRINAAVHLLDWPQARFYVKACNPSGCSSSNEVGIDGEQLEAMGYFKPSTYGPYKFFGYNLAVSADGTTLAVPSVERIEGQPGAFTAIHVYRKTSPTSAWRLDARFSPSPNLAAMNDTREPIALSADGKVLAFGNWRENGYSGAVYLFRRDAAGWRQTQRILSNGQPEDQFGGALKLDDAGRTLVVLHQKVGTERRIGTVSVYQDPADASNQFVHAAEIPTPVFDDPQNGMCRGVDVSSIGTIARACLNGTGANYVQILTPLSSVPLQYAETARLNGGWGERVSITAAGDQVLTKEFNSLRVFRRTGSTWVADAPFEPSFSAGTELTRAAMSGDGKIIAVGSMQDTRPGLGPLFGSQFGPSEPSGTVAVYERRATGWRLRRYVKAGSSNTLESFGYEVALNHNGNLLAVTAPFDSSAAVRVDGDREDESVPDRGAVWLY